MARPIVIAHHLIWTTYGSWLPNDPRGSTSTSVRSDLIAQIGELHFGRKSIQPAGQEIRTFYEQASDRLEHTTVRLNRKMRDIVGAAFHEAIAREKYTCYACAVMPDHVHLILRKHKNGAEQMMHDLRTAAKYALHADGSISTCHPVWSSGLGWKVFLDHPDDVRRTVQYIEANPAGMGLPQQRWDFVKAYDGWPLHPGHSPNSPYARRLRNEASR